MRCVIVGMLALVSVLLNSTVAAAAVQWSGNGHWYEAFVVPDGITWSDAQAAAVDKGGYLASVATEAENTFVFNLVSDAKFWTVENVYYGSLSRGPWLGGYQYDKNDEPAGHWAWLDGDDWDYTNWSITSWTAEPNNGGGAEDWLGFFHLEVGGSGLYMGDTWNDYFNDCSGLMISYVVEFVPEPATLLVWSLLGGLGISIAEWRRRRRAV